MKSTYLNSLTIEKLSEILPQIDDLEALRAAAVKETRVSAKKLFAERIAALENVENLYQESPESAPVQQSTLETGSAPIENVGEVVVRLVAGLSYYCQGISFKKDDVRAVSPDVARSLLETGLFKVVVREETGA